VTQAPSEGDRPPPPLFVVALISLFVAGVLFVTLGFLTQLFNLSFGLWFGELFIFFGVPFLALRLCGYDTFRTAGLGRPWLAGAGFGFLVGALNFFTLVVPLQFLSQKLVPKEWIEMFDMSGIFKHQTPLELFGVVGGVCLAAPFGEEFLFRGVFQRGLAQRLEATRAVVMTGFIFSFFHLDPVGFLARWELGVLFGLLAWRSGSIWPGVFAHLANNAVSTALYFSSKDSPEDDVDARVLLAMIAVGLPLMWGLVKVAERWPAVLTPDFRAEDTRKPGDFGRLIGTWAAAAAVAVALLFAADRRGVALNIFDLSHPLKEPKKEDGPQARRQWDELWTLRDQARRGSKKVEEYEAARRSAIDARRSARPDAGIHDEDEL
jgi:membrane protease YdiL (CAAX protease family)